MKITELVHKLTEAGATPLIISIAVEAVESVSVSVLRTNEDSPQDIPDTRADRIRKLDRLRKQKKRLNLKKTNGLSKANDVDNQPGIKPDKNTDVSMDKGSKRPNLTSLLPSLLSESGNQEEGKKDRVDTPAKNKKGTRLSENTSLSQANYEFAIEHGIITPGDAWKEFVDFWIGVPGQRGVKLNWDSTWRNRVRELAKRNGGKNGNGTYHPKPGNEAGMAEALARRHQGGLFRPDNYGKPIIDGTATEIRAIGNSELEEFGK